jgi:hypothetical protein
MEECTAESCAGVILKRQLTCLYFCSNMILGEEVQRNTRLKAFPLYAFHKWALPFGDVRTNPTFY